MDITEALVSASASLAEAGVANPRGEAATLLTFAIRRERVFLVAHPEYQLTDSEMQSFADAVQRRCQREPFHLIAGSREFFRHEFLVERGVLIPRPETEILVEQTISLLSSGPRPEFLEIGVGTGCISVSILKALPEATGVAVDISDKAIALAQVNSARHDVLERLELRLASLYDGAGVYDLIVSNPPYVPLRDKDTLEPEVSEFDPHAALFSGDDGLDVVRSIVTHAPEHLRSGGYLLMEIGAGQAAAVEELFQGGNWTDVEFIPDLQGIPRVVQAKKGS